MTRADKLLEGFKLGSLGVNHKPKVSSDRVEIVKEGINKYKDVEFPFFCWKDDDGWVYFLNLEPFSETDICVLKLNGGPKLKIGPSGYSEFQDWVVPENMMWDVWSHSLRYDKASSLYKEWVSIVKKQGINGLLIQEVLLSFSLSNMFKDWLEKKKKGEVV
jgi:hypothetical protein